MLKVRTIRDLCDAKVRPAQQRRNKSPLVCKLWWELVGQWQPPPLYHFHLTSLFLFIYLSFPLESALHVSCAVK